MFYADSLPNDTKSTSDLLLKHLLFLYKDLDNSDPQKAFCSQLMIQLLATIQLPAIKCFIQVPVLHTTVLTHSGVTGIISLCGAVVPVPLIFFLY